MTSRCAAQDWHHRRPTRRGYTHDFAVITVFGVFGSIIAGSPVLGNVAVKTDPVPFGELLGMAAKPVGCLFLLLLLLPILHLRLAVPKGGKGDETEEES